MIFKISEKTDNNTKCYKWDVQKQIQTIINKTEILTNTRIGCKINQKKGVPVKKNPLPSKKTVSRKLLV